MKIKGAKPSLNVEKMRFVPQLNGDRWETVGVEKETIYFFEKPESQLFSSLHSPFATSGIRLAHEIADEPANAFMIEKNRNTSRADINGHAISDYQGIRVIHLKAVSVDQRHGKWPIWFSLLERSQNVIKVSRFH
jgi:hypothetical protein